MSLLLLVPAPSIGTYCGMILFPDSAIGLSIFAFSKIWLVVLPVLWYLCMDKGKISGSPARKGGFIFGAVSGVLISGIILAAYFLLGDYFFSESFFQEKMQSIGLASVSRFIIGALYWITVNSVLEEYVWRWFVVRQCETIFNLWTGILVSAMLFTLHHIVALKVYMPWPATLLCSAGIFIGGTVWSYMYTRYKSIWPGYLSHAIVDLCIFGIGALMIFG